MTPLRIEASRSGMSRAEDWLAELETRVEERLKEVRELALSGTLERTAEELVELLPVDKQFAGEVKIITAVWRDLSALLRERGARKLRRTIVVDLAGVMEAELRRSGIHDESEVCKFHLQALGSLETRSGPQRWHTELPPLRTQLETVLAVHLRGDSGTTPQFLAMFAIVQKMLGVIGTA